MNMGWRCPNCGGCYSPTTPQCYNCTGRYSSGSSTNTSADNCIDVLKYLTTGPIIHHPPHQLHVDCNCEKCIPKTDSNNVI